MTLPARRVVVEKMPPIVKGQLYVEWRATFEKYVGSGGSHREAIGHMVFQAASSLGLPPPVAWQWPSEYGLGRVAIPDVVVERTRSDSLSVQWRVTRGPFVGLGERVHIAAGDMFLKAALALGLAPPKIWLWPDGLNPYSVIAK